MKALRLILTQSKAHYRKEESIENKLTYPLPPFSTVIGAIHSACGFTEYHNMDLSIQGTYSSLIKQAYTDYCFLDSTMDDRGVLVKMKSSTAFSTAFEKVAAAKKSTGNSFKKGITIDVYNQKLLNEYRELRSLNDSISEFKKNRIEKIMKLLKIRKKKISDKKKTTDKKSSEFSFLDNKEKELKKLEKHISERVKDFETKEYIEKISLFQSLTTSLKFYEVLLDVRLIIHIKSDEDNLLKTIKDNIYNLKSIGRSEDFVNIEDCEIIDIRELKEEEEIESKIPAYIDISHIKNKNIFFSRDKKGISANGTKYYLGKTYTKENGYREFRDKKKVLYTSNYNADEDSEGIYVDDSKKKYLINFN